MVRVEDEHYSFSEFALSRYSRPNRTTSSNSGTSANIPNVSAAFSSGRSGLSSRLSSAISRSRSVTLLQSARASSLCDPFSKMDCKQLYLDPDPVAAIGQPPCLFGSLHPRSHRPGVSTSPMNSIHASTACPASPVDRGERERGRLRPGSLADSGEINLYERKVFRGLFGWRPGGGTRQGSRQRARWVGYRRGPCRAPPAAELALRRWSFAGGPAPGAPGPPAFIAGARSSRYRTWLALASMSGPACALEFDWQRQPRVASRQPEVSGRPSRAARAAGHRARRARDRHRAGPSS